MGVFLWANSLLVHVIPSTHISYSISSVATCARLGRLHVLLLQQRVKLCQKCKCHGVRCSLIPRLHWNEAVSDVASFPGCVGMRLCQMWPHSQSVWEEKMAWKYGCQSAFPAPWFLLLWQQYSMHASLSRRSLPDQVREGWGVGVGVGVGVTLPHTPGGQTYCFGQLPLLIVATLLCLTLLLYFVCVYHHHSASHSDSCFV